MTEVATTYDPGLDGQFPFEIFTCKTDGFFAPIIDWATDGDENHTYITLGDHSVSMEPGGLIKRPLGYWGPNNPHSQFKLNADKIVKLDAFIHAHRNAKYDYAGDVLVGVDELTGEFADKLFHLLEHVEDKVSPFWFCSAFADAAFTYAGVTVIEGRRKWEEHGVTPMDLYRECFVPNGWEPPYQSRKALSVGPNSSAN